MKAKFLLQPHFYQNKRIQLKQVLREKFIALRVHARTEERFTISDLSFHLKKLEKGVLFLHNGLKIRHCHCRGLGHCCDMGLIPGLGKFPIPCVWPKKKKKKKARKRRVNLLKDCRRKEIITIMGSSLVAQCLRTWYLYHCGLGSTLGLRTEIPH